MKRAIFEIFRTGKHNGTGAGAKQQWQEAHLKQIQQFYSEAIKPANLVIGHPDDNEPQFGTVKKIVYHENALFAEAELNDELYQKIKAGEFSGISSSFYLPNSPRNPIKRLGIYLKHVGFLEKGKQTPAVKGMLNPQESIEYLSYSEDENIVLFCEESQDALTYADNLHQKIIYFQNVLAIDYATAFKLSTQ